jgi:cytochrome oxidase Cu insertion factor (SCO1/SenC/PrrC family)
MPGMTTGLDPADPTIVAAFRAALLHQGIVALVVIAVLVLAWAAVRDGHPATGGAAAAGGAARAPAEPAARRVLRVGFGLLWLLDGVLQAQPRMPAGLPSQVLGPSAAAAPGWVQHLVSWAGTAWSYHPVQAAAATVWIQAGIGLWLLCAARGRLSRLAGAAGAGWGLVVWVFGEALGGVLSPGLSWLTGAPGAAALYVAAGVLVSLPARTWAGPRLGRVLAGGTGLFLLAMAVLQAWPGRGSWAGRAAGQPGPLAAMVGSMAATAQPRPLAELAAGSAALARAHGFGVNLLAVIALALLGAALAAVAAGRAGPGWAPRAAAVALTVACVADWVLVQDFGVFGGLGTDPNSMIPFALLGLGGCLALTRPPAAAPPAPVAARPSWRARLRPAALPGAVAAAGPRAVLAAGAVAVIALGTIPMAAAQASGVASPILAEALDGASAPLSAPAPGFALTDQHGARVSLASLRGRAVLLTFLDPVSLTDAPVQAAELRQAGRLLGARDRRVELVAVNLNPVYGAVAYTRAFDREAQLAGTPNWLFLTGGRAQLQPVWQRYGIASQILAAGAEIGHSDAAFVISPGGRLREEISFDPGPGTAATRSSFAGELAGAVRQALAG